MELVVDDLNCGYYKHEPIISHVSFTLHDGGICCLLGPNGCGKTTLFKTILGILPALSGRVLIDGENIAKWKPAKMASVFAYVSQDHTPPYSYLVKDVVMMGRTSKIGYMGTPKADDVSAVNSAMMAMGIYDMRERSYTDLSGGELQLCMIARALAQEPKILVLDEPTAALDYGNAMRVIGKVMELAESGLAIIMTTHSPDHAFMCKSDAVLLHKANPAIAGSAVDVVTERNLKATYGVDIKIVGFTNSKNEQTYLCTPIV